jgi:biotin synthase
MDARDIVALGEAVLAGHAVSRADALALAGAGEEDSPLLAAYAHKIRARFAGRAVDMCGVVNARAGLCPEDCKFCAQSVRHAAASPVFPLIGANEALAAYAGLAAAGARRASLVTSGKGMERDPDFPRIAALVAAVVDRSPIGVCANLGTLGRGQAARLAAAGLRRYAHNLETSERFYPQICTTHPYAERHDTLLAAREAGLELCSGGVIGLGETWADRIDLALTLRALDVASVPLNILNPLPGTALEHQPPLPPLEIIKTFAIFRFILPGKVIRPAGGREVNLRDLQGAVMLAGANGLIIGNYLTFGGRDCAADFAMVRDAGLIPDV